MIHTTSSEARSQQMIPPRPMINTTYFLRGRRGLLRAQQVFDDGVGEAALYNIHAFAAQHFSNHAAPVVKARGIVIRATYFLK